MKVDTRSTLTAIVCAYNEEKTLLAALHSLFAQTRVPDEVIVVNNASTDRTRAVAERILKEIRSQGALSIACHPHHRTTRRIEISTCYVVGPSRGVGRSRRSTGGRQS